MYNPSTKVQSTQPCSGTTFRAHCKAAVEMVTPHTFREMVSVVWTGTVCTGLSNIASFFCFASHNQKRLKQAEVMENRERTKQHHNFVTLPRANETPILRLSCCHPSGSNSLFETDGERGRERERERDRESNHDRCTIPVEKYKVRNPALVPLFVLTAKQKLKWSHLIHSEKWYRLYGQAPYAPAYQTSHPFFCFASHNQKRLKQAEVMENRERTKQHHNFVTLPRANETPILRLSCCHPSGSNSLFETDGERGRERDR